jgi:hypothetical protein
VHLCTGEHTVADIVERLLQRYATEDRAAVEREVIEFLNTMAERCLVVEGVP